MHLIPIARPTPPPATRGDLRQRAEAFETAFLAEMLRAAGTVRMSTGLGAGDGGDGQVFDPYLAEAQARALVAAGGLGLTEALMAALARRTGEADQ